MLWISADSRIHGILQHDIGGASKSSSEHRTEDDDSDTVEVALRDSSLSYKRIAAEE